MSQFFRKLIVGAVSLAVLVGPAMAAEQDEDAFAAFIGGMLDGCSYSEAHSALLGTLYRHHFEGEPLVYPVVPGVAFGELVVENAEWPASLWVPVNSTWHGLRVSRIGLEAERDNGFHVELLSFAENISVVREKLDGQLKLSNKRLRALDTDGMGYASLFIERDGETMLVCDLST